MQQPNALVSTALNTSTLQRCYNYNYNNCSNYNCTILHMHFVIEEVLLYVNTGIAFNLKSGHPSQGINIFNFYSL